MFQLFDLTPDLVCIATKEGFFKKVNRSVINKLEYSEEDLFSSPISSFIHPDDKAQTSSTRAELLLGKALINFQNRYITRTGKILWLQWTSVYIPDKEIVFAIAKDVTESKLKDLEIEEKYKKFKELTSHFKSKMESDKKYIADQLHEDLAQLATVVKMDIDWVRKNTTDLAAPSRDRIEHALEVNQLLIDSIRRISYTISPNMLYDLGLNETLKWLCEEHAFINGISCEFESDYDTDALSPEIQLDFFRICQIALSNITLHARSSEIKIAMASTENGVGLCIAGNEEGEDISQNDQDIILSTIRERATSMNANVHVMNETGKGIRICVTLPIAKDDLKHAAIVKREA